MQDRQKRDEIPSTPLGPEEWTSRDHGRPSPSRSSSLKLFLLLVLIGYSVPHVLDSGTSPDIAIRWLPAICALLLCCYHRFCCRRKGHQCRKRDRMVFRCLPSYH